VKHNIVNFNRQGIEIY
jgi:hypothetical protein